MGRSCYSTEFSRPSIHCAKIHGIRVVFISVTVSTFGRVKKTGKYWPSAHGSNRSPIMGTCRIAGLARSVGSDRAIPVARVGDDPERGPGRLVIVVRRAVDRMAVPAAWERSEIEAAPAGPP